MNSSPVDKPGFGKRFIQFPVTRIILAMVFLVVPAQLLAWLIRQFLPSLSKTLPATLLGITLALLCYYAYVRLIERRQVSELGLKGMFKELGSGLLIGAFLLTASFAVLAVLNVYQIDGNNPWTVLLAPLVMALTSGVVEEIVFRGILFRIVEESLGSWISLSVSACIFGLIHLLNPQATLFGAIAIIIEAGILLGAAYMVTRRLWMCIGIHIAWNFTQSGIFSGIVSGNIDLPGVIRGKMVGPDWLTGGQFGIEASVVAVVICLAAGIFFVDKARRDNKIVQPFWRRSKAIDAAAASLN